ncbi:hypothetical protein KSP39_PZI022824 [Platanthera zijinensis]|uniref:C2H2-type domain-containing protein n=1 Tax=Platanthera zijinensis TaxID=2320716 RepID=A0AAP0AV15_9ASPA
MLQNFPTIHLLLSLLLMALTSFLPHSSAAAGEHHHRKAKRHHHQPLITLSSWDHLKALLSCKTSAPAQVQDPSSSSATAVAGKKTKLRSSWTPSICDVVHVRTRVFHRSDQVTGTGPFSCSSALGETYPLRRRPADSGAQRGGAQLIRFSGCYECHAVEAEPSSRRYPRPSLCACPQCGEVFTKTDSLELHQTLRHAVSELAPEDSGRHIVEIIFKSSWQKKDRPICKIDRILKVHNTPRTIARFEDYRAAVKSRAAAAAALRNPFSAAGHNPRCSVDGNELLRFHSASLSCQLGAAGSNSLCPAASSSAASAAAGSACGVCAIIRHGFRRPYHPLGVVTTVSSGRAHDHNFPPAAAGCAGGRAMLVCRVIAGRIRVTDDSQAGGCGYGSGYDYDSVGAAGTNLEELFVANPRAILPCFVVIYRAQD